MMRLIFIPVVLLLFLGCKEDDSQVGLLELQGIVVGATAMNLDGSSENVPNDRTISLTFSHPVEPSSAEIAISLASDEDDVQLNFNAVSNNKVVNISPIGTLKTNTIYTLTCNDQLKGENGQAFTTKSITFKTLIGNLELLGIQLDNKDILNSGTTMNAPVDLEIAFNFSEAVSKESFENALTIAGPGNPVLLVSYENENKTVKATTQNPLNHLRKYEIMLSDELNGTEGQGFVGSSFDFYTSVDSTNKFPLISDEALLTKVQSQTFKYFWDFAHPVSGLIRERNTSGNLVTIGGSGFGLMAIIVGIERGFISRDEGIARWTKIIDFLADADRFHGVWPHWMHGETGKTIPFSANDDGADLVETSFLIQGLLTVRQYLNASNTEEQSIIEKINSLWDSVEWQWFQQEDQNRLYWHWSPNFGWEKNLAIAGWNESLMVYILAAASKTHSISKTVYEEGWARGGAMGNGNKYFDVQLPLGPQRGGPLFFAHYSFLGLDPRNLKDQYANYWEQNVNHSMINQLYCINNPNHYAGYGAAAWGLTASDTFNGYTAHSPNNDIGTISPTAALASMPYTPEASTAALKHFYYLMGNKLWGEYGFYDAYNVTENWYADSYLAIDQGPIIIMIENHRSGLLWDLFMSAPEIQAGLTKLEFNY